MQEALSVDELRKKLQLYKDELHKIVEQITSLDSQSAIAYNAYIIERMKKPAATVIDSSIDDLLTVLDSIEAFCTLERYLQITDNSMRKNQCQTDSIDYTYSRLAQYGMTLDWLKSHGLSTRNVCSPISTNEAVGISYKKIKGGIRIDNIAASGGVVIPDYINAVPVIKIGSRAFAKRKDITSVILPQFLTEIEDGAFSETNLVSISIPDSVEKIGESAFFNCRQLQRVRLPLSLKVIKTNTFGGCTSLTTISVPNGVTAISERAFDRAKNLKSIQIPKSVTRIGYAAFSSKAVVFCDYDSRASRYVSDNNLPFYQPYEMYGED